LKGLRFNMAASHASAGKRLLKASTYTLLMILVFASALTLTPKAFSAAASASFQLQDGLVKVEVTSPVDVYQFQLSVTLPSGASLDTSKAVFTGFMQNSLFLNLGSEYRWFSLNAVPSKTGSITVPAAGLSAENKPQLIRLDLLDSSGNKIELQQTLPLTATLAPITITTTVRETITQTTTLTSTITQPTTVTSTSTVTRPTTVTLTVTQPTTATVTSTVTQPTATTVTSTQTDTRTVTQTEAKTITQTATSTTTLTTTRTEVSTTTAYKEVAVDTTLYIVAIVVLIIIVIILAVLLFRRRGA